MHERQFIIRIGEFMLGSLFGFSIANLKSFKRNQDGARRG